MNTELIEKLNKETEHCKSWVERWNNKEIEHQQYWSCPTACVEAIAKYGAENIYLVSSSYHGRYEDDDASFTYYNNVTGEFFHDEWSTRFAAPSYGSYECFKFLEAWENDLVDKEKLYKNILERDIKIKSNFNYSPFDNFKTICKWGLRVKVSRGRKWKGTGYLIGTFTTSYQWGIPRWRSDNGYGTTTTRYAKIYDPSTNHIETVNASYVEFLDLDKSIEEYKNIYIEALKNSTVDNLCVGKSGSSYSPFSGDHFGTPIYIQIPEMEKFEIWIEKTHSNHFDLSIAYDVVEEEARKKAEEFKASKMPDIIKWVKENTDKTTEEDINTLAEHIFNKKYN